MKRIICVICMFALLNISCATVFKGSNSKIDVNSEPTGAEVKVNGFSHGKTPMTLTLESKKTYQLELTKEGYKAAFFSISHHVQGGWIVLDILFGLVGVIIDAVTGAWYEKTSALSKGL